MNVPNALSGLRIALVPLFAWLYARGSELAAFGVVLVAGATDWLDGWLARKLGQVSELGKVLDPVADRVAVVAGGIVLVMRDAIWAPVAVAILLRELAVSVGFFVLQARGYPRIEVSRIGKVATSVIFFGLAAGAAGSAFTNLGQELKIVSTFVLVVGTAIYWLAGGLYMKEARRMTPVRN